MSNDVLSYKIHSYLHCAAHPFSLEKEGNEMQLTFKFSQCFPIDYDGTYLQENPGIKVACVFTPVN